MPIVKLVVAKCDSCGNRIALCVSNSKENICRDCDTTGTYIKLSTYKK